MRLKTLEIKGFKSFADETVIHFNEDVIGIVGPNGSGKSNVVDAIRWVLGEQKSSELRLDTMSSVIFNGTKTRKQGGVAQVTLSFENTKNLLPTEYNSVAITRRLYRSGESEYQLNGVVCRLKDITNLLMDTGIGSNSYAIIALGMVDEILADKDNARRKMFEQAAGISKYKIRKRETLQKLQATTADLERVEDLLFEINNNLKTLEQQAKRTKKYFELKGEYKDLSIKLAALKSESLKARYKELKDSLEKEEDRYRQLEVEQRQMEAGLEQQRKSNLDQEQALSERQREMNQLVGKIRDMENEKRVLEQRITFVEQNKTKSQEAILIAKSRISTLEEEIAGYRETLTEDRRLEGKLEQQLEAAEKRLSDIRQSHGEMKAGLDAIMQNQQQVERELYELEKSKAVNTNQIENLRHDIAHGEEEVKNRTTETESLRSKIKELEKEEAERRASVEALEQTEEKRREAIAEGETKLDDLKSRVQKIHRELDAKRNEYKLTKSMVESLEGFPESIRFLSSAKNWTKQAPLLSDLIYVEVDYRVAIENYLEPYLNFYVTENMTDAQQAVQLLQSAQKGKANFFVNDSFKDFTPSIAMLSGDMRPATDLVQCDPVYRNLVNYLLDNVFILEKEEVTKQMSDEKITLLAKSGRFIQRRHSLSGGSVGLFEGKKIGRKKNLEILENAIKRGEEDENKLSTEMYQLKSSIEILKGQQSRQQIQQEQNLLNKVSQERVSLAARLDSFESYIRDVDAKKVLTLERIKGFEAANAASEKLLEEKLQTADVARKEISNTDGKFRAVAEEMSQASTEFNNNNIEFIKQQNKVSALQRELSFREKQLDETKATLATNQRSLDQSGDEVAQINDDIERLVKELQVSYEVRKEKEGALSQTEQTFFSARNIIHEIEDKLRQLARQSQESQIKINNTKDKYSDTKYQLTNIAERLRIEFNLSINDHEALTLTEEQRAGLDENDLQIKVERMKGRLDNYGEINPMALEAYEEMKERHDTITEQRDDILKAKDDLMETIREIEETATAQFLEAFGKVRLYFIDAFRSLFTNDDTADLILLDPENPLESSIEIVAKPKGKRPQSISQLSGGEKTLTATALLFSLYLLKPAPFCIFDEVDAPLDDANIEKFNHIIKDFSKDSQFIIVTHNKQTMAAVDTIYGVYMAEQGVSAVTPVDFRSLKNDLVFSEVEN
ncbi:MAG: chromosome segregation protein SMC [Saprospiraceae bacterium]|nr:chromosome segregation protein SMC [Saprospiraceae bacterium]MCF8248333.1 chromosome segregation protein SMC [Saprospiraceae bacterium]MCF8280228.1 chromosome segregation protein SMC [Bacteroidales bacterium]MCF8309861.1 chromosome segregation protein SMC [Saprospiraceae bacterium]MCF8438808.1 chromosome segregation protein SMC [Saprospiraceae bacterium]